MFKNLDEEQQKLGLKNQDIAQKLLISEKTYEAKKTNGNFTILEAKKLCEIFNVTFDYLFNLAS